MDYLSLFAGILGIGPAMLIMFYTLSQYTYPKVELPFFDDRKVFMLFTVGLVVGVVLATVRIFFDMGDPLVIIFFSLLVLLVPMVILLLKRFAVRLDTAFYGCALGLGMGATMAFQLSYRVLNAYVKVGESIPPEAYLIVAVWSLQMVLITTVCATLIGIGSARGRPWYYFGQALALLIVYNLLLLPLYQLGDDPFTYVTFTLATVYTIMCYWYIRSRALPDLVQEAIDRMGKKKKKRETTS
ncbi:MAG: hypothetical protein A4E32_01753 [Methanomassiliicoccales archaeon PtaU1.Bin124]|nr:MAG: hypothetical protein A4E32_01753 [Methanomassiliicoccales archaeon PtaU1.Bin124]